MNNPSTPDKTLTGLTVLFCVVFIGLAGRLVYIQGVRPDSPATPWVLLLPAPLTFRHPVVSCSIVAVSA